MQNVVKDISRAAWHCWGHNGWGPDQAIPLQSREDFVWRRKEDSEAQGEEIRAVSRSLEDVTRDVEFPMADGHEYTLLVEPRHQLRQSVELRVREEAHKMRAGAWRDMVTLEVQGDVSKSLRITVNV